MKIETKLKTYALTVSLACIAFIVSAISNLQYESKTTIYFWIILTVLFLFSIILVYKYKLLEICSNVTLYLTSLVLFSNAINLFPDDQSALFAIVALSMLAYFLLRKKYSFLLYSIFNLVVFLVLILTQTISLPLSVASKFLITYIIVAVIIILNRKNDMEELEHTQKNKLELEKSKLELEKNIRKLEETKKETDKLNKLMVGREVKMIELKKQVDNLKKTK